MPSGNRIFDAVFVVAWMLGVPAADPRHAAALFNSQSEELRAQLGTKRGSGNFSGFCSAIVRLLMLGQVQAAWVGCQLAHATMSFAISKASCKIESWSASMRLLNANRGVRFVGDMCRAVIARLPEHQQAGARLELALVGEQEAGTASSVMRLLKKWCADVFSPQHEGQYYLDLILGRMEWILAQQDVTCLRQALQSGRGFACNMKPPSSRGRQWLLAAARRQPAVSHIHPASHAQPAASHTHPAAQEPPPKRARTDEYAYGGAGCGAGAGSDEATTSPLLDDVSREEFSGDTARDSTYHGEQNEDAAFLDALLSDDFSFSDSDNEVFLESNIFWLQPGMPPPEGSPDPTTDNSPGPSHGSDRS